MKAKVVVLFLCLVAVTGSAVSVIVAKHETRKHFVELQKMQNERDEMQIEESRLLLELNTWATHSRIEKLAKDKLGMRLPNAKEIVILRQ